MGGFRLKPSRLLTYLAAGVLLAVGIALAVDYFGKPHATLRITTGVEGGIARRFISAFVQATHAAHPRIDFRTVQVADLAASAKAMEEGRVDLALVRTDVSPPRNGQTLVILRRDVVAIVLPPGSPIDDVGKLTGKTVVIPAGPLQENNSRVFDLILNYFNVDPSSVKRVYLPVREIGPALEHRRAAAALAVGPIGPGEAVDVVAAIARATRGAPTILGLDDNDAISARFPALESISIPAGAFRPRPATPDDDISGVAVSYRFVVPATMLDIVAGALGRSIINTKARLMQLTPLASQIEAPDPSQTNTILPVHPGFANYLNSGDQSFFDEMQSYIYFIGVPLSLLGSLAALLMGWIGRRGLQDRQDKLLRLLAIADEAVAADETCLKSLEHEYSEIVSASVNQLLDGSLAAEHGSPVMLAVHHAREALNRRQTAQSRRQARSHTAS